MAIVDVVAGFYALLTRWCGHAFEGTDALNERTAIAHSPCQTIVVVTDETASGTVCSLITAPTDVGISTTSGAIRGVAGKIVAGADVIVVAAGGAITVAILSCLNDIITTGGIAIGVGVGVATISAALVAVNTFGDKRVGAMGRAFASGSDHRIGGAAIQIKAVGWATRAFTIFTRFDNIISTDRSAIIIVEIVAAGSTATVTVHTLIDIRVGAGDVT